MEKFLHTPAYVLPNLSIPVVDKTYPKDSHILRYIKKLSVYSNHVLDCVSRSWK